MLDMDVALGVPSFRGERRMDGLKHVLVVEDDVDSRVLLSALLSQMGYVVTSAVNGEEGLRFLHSADYQCDAVVADVIMPGMSGADFARLTHEVRPALPIALVTGRQDGIDVALDAGTVPLLKPFTIGQLHAVWSGEMS